MCGRGIKVAKYSVGRSDAASAMVFFVVVSTSCRDYLGMVPAEVVGAEV